jgi:hypothetical protein
MPHPIHGSYNTTEPDAQFTNYCISMCPRATDNMFPSCIALETCNLLQILFCKYIFLLLFCVFPTAISYFRTVYCFVEVIKTSRVLVMMLVLRVSCLRKCGRIHLLSPNYAIHCLHEIERPGKERGLQRLLVISVSQKLPQQFVHKDQQTQRAS